MSYGKPLSIWTQAGNTVATNTSLAIVQCIDSVTACCFLLLQSQGWAWFGISLSDIFLWKIKGDLEFYSHLLFLLVNEEYETT